MEEHIFRNRIIALLLLIFLILGVGMFFKHKQAKSIKIAFLGDSITENGWIKDYGYVNLFQSALKEAGYDVTVVPAGVSGNTTRVMLNRMDNDVIAQKPDFMFFMGGINNIWFDYETYSDFVQDVTQIVDKARKNNIKVVIVSLTIIDEDLNSIKNETVMEYNNFLKLFANENSILYIDVNKELRNVLKKKNPAQIENMLTYDGVHLNPLGNKIIADKISNVFLKYNKSKFIF